VSVARVPTILWLLLIAVCIAVVSRTMFTTDLSAFLPRSPTAAQQVLVDQLRDGIVSRLMLIGVEGDKPEVLADISKRLADDLRKQDAFVSIDNGEDPRAGADREFVWRHRYLLSPGVAPGRFLPDALRAHLQDSLRLLASPAGILLQRILPSDPSGEILVLMDVLAGHGQPAARHGVWFSRDGDRAVLVAQTRAPSYEIDAQEHAANRIRASFMRVAGQGRARLILTGPGVFSVTARSAIKGDVLRFAIIASSLIILLLLTLFRSPRVLVLALLPVASGALTAVAAVSLGFGAVHGVTLGFGITLLGEGVDYAIYLFSQTGPGTAPERTLDRIWPTLRLGLLTSICGYSAMLLSGFTGLAQLGLFSITGLIVAAAVTRWVLPALLPHAFAAKSVATFVPLVTGAFQTAQRLRYPALIAVALAAGFLFVERGSLWSDDLAVLSPIPRSEQQLDQALRQDLGAPDVRHLVVIRARDEETALQASEAVSADLRDAARGGLIGGFESPSNYLPSRHVQRQRQSALPPPSQLRENLQQALRGLPYRADAFEPFLADVAAAKDSKLVTRKLLEGTRLASKVDGLLVKRADGWAALLPLSGVTDTARLGGMIRKFPRAEISLLDMKREADRLYVSYRDEALTNSLLGAAAIVVLLSLSLRSARRVLHVVAPLVAAVVAVTSIVALVHGKLTIFHLVGLLLVVAVGSNYSLFFDRGLAPGGNHDRTQVSLFFACVSTIIGFGVLSFSRVPVLNAIGSTVGLGAIFALLFAAALRADSGKSGRAAA